MLATILLRQAMDKRDLRQLRRAIATAVREKVAEAAVIEEAEALVPVLATEKVRQAMEHKVLSSLGPAIFIAQELKLPDSLIKEARTVLETERLRKATEQKNLNWLRSLLTLSEVDEFAASAIVSEARALAAELERGRVPRVASAGASAAGASAAVASAAASATTLPPPRPPPTGATARGIKLRGLGKLEDHLRQLVADGHFKLLDPVTYQPIGVVTAYEDLTTGDVVHQWAKLASVTGTDRLADCAAIIDPKDIGLPLYFM